MKKFLIPAIGAAFAFSPVIVPAMFGPAPAHAQAKAKAAKAKEAKGKAKNPMCAIGRPDTHQESWATAYGCWGQKAKIQPQTAGFGPGPRAAAAPGFGPGFGGPGFGAPGQPGQPKQKAAAAKKKN